MSGSIPFERTVKKQQKQCPKPGKGYIRAATIIKQWQLTRAATLVRPRTFHKLRFQPEKGWFRNWTETFTL